MSDQIRIVLLEPLAITGQAIAAWLSGTGPFVVTVVQNRSELWQSLSTSTVSLVLIRCSSADEGTIGLVEEIKKNNPSVRVALLCAYSTAEDLSSAIKAGVDGHFMEGMRPSHFLWNLENVVSQGIPFYSSRAIQNFMNRDEDSTTRLSSREIGVLDLVCRGLTNEEISRDLFISISTVKRHLQDIYLRLGVRNRAEAVSKASQMDLGPHGATQSNTPAPPVRPRKRTSRPSVPLAGLLGRPYN